jgi:hypothetical protein
MYEFSYIAKENINSSKQSIHAKMAKLQYIKLNNTKWKKHTITHVLIPNFFAT